MRRLIFLYFLICPYALYGRVDSLKALPHHCKIQYAGSIGFFSAGLGYSYLKNKLETDVYYGYVPAKYAAEMPLHIYTIKTSWFVLKSLKDQSAFSFHPLTIGVFGSYTSGDQFNLIMTPRYPRGYYGWTTAATLGIFVGGLVNKKINKGNSSIGLYYEIGTTDIEVISYVPNMSSLGIFKILNLGIGLRFRLRD